jgi:hypothetical protein
MSGQSNGEGGGRSLRGVGSMWISTPRTEAMDHSAFVPNLLELR